MITELVFIKVFLSRDNYLKYRSYLSNKDLDNEIVRILGTLDKWYQTNSEGEPTLTDLYLMLLPTSDKTDLLHTFNTLKGLSVPDSAIDALRQYKAKQTLEAISVAAYEASQGNQTAINKLPDLYTALTAEDAEISDDDMFEDWDFDAIFDATDRTTGLKWRLKTFQNYLGNLLPGDFGFFVARPETGKTTMLASEITHMAQNLTEDQGPILWFNNEEGNRKVQFRIVQAAYGLETHELRKNKDFYKAKFTKEYGSKIFFIKEQHLTKNYIELVVTKRRPSLIILDQIDPIEGFKADREDLRLGSIYKWARQLGIKHNCAVLGVSQADNSGEGVAYLYMDNVANAKTEKQATADFIVGIGKKKDDAFQNLRFLHMMKNKLTGKHTKHEVLIKPDIARYEDIE